MSRPRPGKNQHRYTETRILAIRKLGGKCVRCGMDDWRCLQIDHVDGGGAGEYKRIGNGRLYANIVAGLYRRGDYQLLCANCNWIKRFERREHRRSPNGANYSPCTALAPETLTLFNPPASTSRGRQKKAARAS